MSELNPRPANGLIQPFGPFLTFGAAHSSKSLDLWPSIRQTKVEVFCGRG